MLPFISTSGEICPCGRIFYRRGMKNYAPRSFIMKRKLFKMAGVLAVLLVLGFTFTGCGEEKNNEESNPFVGTWRSSDGYVMVFTANGSFTITSSTGNVENGSYNWVSGNGNSTTMTNYTTNSTINVTISGSTLSYGSKAYTKS